MVHLVRAERLALTQMMYRKPSNKTHMEQRHLQLGHHLVAFLDVLGQRERFKGLRLPKTPEESAEVAEVLRQTAGFVIELRRIFDEQFQSFEAGLTNVRRQTNAVQAFFNDAFDHYESATPEGRTPRDVASDRWPARCATPKPLRCASLWPSCA